MSVHNYRTLEAFEESLMDAIGEYADGNNELEDVINAAHRVMCYQANEGIDLMRLPNNPREQAFHDQWLLENAPLSHIDNGHGILQNLFIKRSSPLSFSTEIIEEISNRDRKIVATVIQWLGSNIGMSFLSESLKRFGARVVYD